MVLRLEENDLDFDFDFFSSRGKIKKPRPQRRAVINNILEPIDLERTKTKARSKKGNVYQNVKTGRRADLGLIIPRSSWEANTIRVLLMHQVKFQFEPHIYSFPPDSKGRIKAYLPDIYLDNTDEYIEVKGWLDSKGRNKLRLFKKNYPSEFSRLTMIISKSNKANKTFCQKLGVPTVLYYEHLIKLYKNKIVNWE